jgi:hypothetical protein
MIKIPEESPSISIIGNRSPPTAHSSPKTTAMCMNSFRREGICAAADPITAIGVPMKVGIKAVALAISEITYAATPQAESIPPTIIDISGISIPNILYAIFSSPSSVGVSNPEAATRVIPTQSSISTH